MSQITPAFRLLLFVKNDLNDEGLVNASKFILDNGNDGPLIFHLYLEYNRIVPQKYGSRLEMITNPNKIFENQQERDAIMKEIIKFIKEKTNENSVGVINDRKKINNS